MEGMTREKFEAYVEVQKSGITNMMAIRKVIEYADELCDVELTKIECLYMMHNYSDLKEKYMGGE